MRALLQHYPILAGLFVALVCFWMASTRERLEAERCARIAELNSGAEERFFEERRSLESYHTLPTWVLWFAGLAALVFAGYEALA